MDRHRLGPSDEVKALGAGADSGAVHPAADTPPPKRRFRWKLLLAGVALVALGYALAETALAFGWWGPIAEDLELTSEDRRGSNPYVIEVGACDAALEVMWSVSDHINELTDRINAAYKEPDIDEMERLGVKRGASVEALKATDAIVDDICGDDPEIMDSLRFERARNEDVYDGWSSFCDDLGWLC